MSVVKVRVFTAQAIAGVAQQRLPWQRATLVQLIDFYFHNMPEELTDAPLDAIWEWYRDAGWQWREET